jgi:hypothetical protein
MGITIFFPTEEALEDAKSIYPVDIEMKVDASTPFEYVGGEGIVPF